MRQKRAKELRRLAYSIPELPDKDYEEFNIQEGPRMYMGSNGLAVSEPIRTSTVCLTKSCRRSWYQAMKKSYKLKQPVGSS